MLFIIPATCPAISEPALSSPMYAARKAPETAQKRLASHDPHAPLLCDALRPGDVVTDRKDQSKQDTARVEHDTELDGLSILDKKVYHNSP